MKTTETIAETPEILQPHVAAPLAVVPKASLAQFEFTAEQIELIKDQVCKGATDSELALFLHVAKSRRLDPLQRQIYAVFRMQKQSDGSKRRVMTIQTGIDGFRSIANRTNDYAPSEKPTQFTLKQNGKQLESATVWVKKFAHGEWHEYSATAFFDEYNTGEWMWERMPHGQIEKCAEAKALRKGWPEDCGGIYIPEEMAKADMEAQADSESKRKNRAEKSIGKMKPSSEPNRGHNDTGLNAQDVARSIPGVKLGSQIPVPKAAEDVNKAEAGKTIDYHENQDEPLKSSLIDLHGNPLKGARETKFCDILEVHYKQIGPKNKPTSRYVELYLENEDKKRTTARCYHSSLLAIFKVGMNGCKFVVTKDKQERLVIERILWLDGEQFSHADDLAVEDMKNIGGEK